jgi:hypothetical protein
MKIIKKFLEHPRSIGETYSQHLRYAFKTAVKLNFAGGVLAIHAFFPFLFERTASDAVLELAREIEQRGKKHVQC